ncbi:MAG: hypothetical protein K2I10_08475 [Lachnospiraceae bacterium]|nr:hypothetical protein [Lachnospiraceae bacterium]
MIVSIMNPCDQEPCQVDGDFVTNKQESGHGYGLKNVKNVSRGMKVRIRQCSITVLTERRGHKYNGTRGCKGGLR